MQNESGNSEKVRHVRVRARDAQETIEALRKEDAIDYRYRVFNRNGHVFIPVTENYTGGFPDAIVEPQENPEGKYPARQRGSYDLVGEIAIIHRRDDSRSRKLAKNIIESAPSVKAVFLDVGITGKFRVRELRLLEGEDIRRTDYRENGIILTVDLSKVYFSPRLATERMRVARATRDGETVIDMFAGLGPFSILIAKLHSARVTAIDSNPDAIELLSANMSRNRLAGTIEAVCADSSEYMKGIVNADRIIMNLPHDAGNFLKSAADSLKTGGTIHYYEICSIDRLVERMEMMRHLGLEVVSKREVHGYSKSDRMYALDLIKIL